MDGERERDRQTDRQSVKGIHSQHVLMMMMMMMMMIRKYMKVTKRKNLGTGIINIYNN